mgnify:CR=1 FL=1
MPSCGVAPSLVSSVLGDRQSTPRLHPPPVVDMSPTTTNAHSWVRLSSGRVWVHPVSVDAGVLLFACVLLLVEPQCVHGFAGMSFSMLPVHLCVCV